MPYRTLRRLILTGAAARSREPFCALKFLADTSYVPPTLLANVAFTQGNADDGFEYLQQALKDRYTDIIFITLIEC
ncbi:hypothetical protein [Aliiglaciecola sp. M165]|uniref:hypothetical protein n=1 Tax=Aliiglaciecola sp. M165 TaxID=2593649 RepID=UPI00117BF936|nr:hypothetical protein [Aliiglaciecola sp. M165]TRY31741.1 hypothetical protein FM019_07790 [Aliiglaciecola sp. M165]